MDRLQSGNSLTLVLQNGETNAMRFDGIDVFGLGTSGKLTNANLVFQPGEKKSLAIAMSSPCKPGYAYDYYVNITYSNADRTIAGQKQRGAKTLIGKCA